MNDEQQAAQSIGKFLQLIKGLGELKPGLESLGSVKQAEAEVKSRLSALKIDEAALVNKTQQLRVELGGLEKKAELIKDGAKADGEAELKRANGEAQIIINEAHAAAHANTTKAQVRLDELSEEIGEAEGKLKSLNDGCKLAQKRLDQTTAELDRIVQRARG